MAPFNTKENKNAKKYRILSPVYIKMFTFATDLIKMDINP